LYFILKMIILILLKVMAILFFLYVIKKYLVCKYKNERVVLLSNFLSWTLWVIVLGLIIHKKSFLITIWLLLATLCFCFCFGYLKIITLEVSETKISIILHFSDVFPKNLHKFFKMKQLYIINNLFKTPKFFSLLFLCEEDWQPPEATCDPPESICDSQDDEESPKK